MIPGRVSLRQVPADHVQAHVSRTDPDRLVLLLPQRQRLLPGRQGVVHLVGDHELHGEPVVQLGALAGRARRGELQGRAQMIRRLAMSAEVGGPAAGLQAVPVRRVRLVRLRRVPGQSADVHAASPFERGQDLPVDHDPPHRRDRLGNRGAGQLVPEAELVTVRRQEAALDALIHPWCVRTGRGDQDIGIEAHPELRGDVEGTSRRLGKRCRAGEYDVPHGGRTARLRRDHLAHEVGVARRLSEDLARVEPRPADHRRHTGLGQRPDRQPSRRTQPGELADEPGQHRVRADLVVAVGRQQQGGNLPEAAPGIEQEVGARVVDPVQVLDEHDVRLLSQGGQDAGEQVIPRQRDVDLELGRNLDDRAERARGRGAVARTGRDRHGHSVEEGRDQRRLSRAGLATDEDQRALAGARALQELGQCRQLWVALDQCHGEDATNRPGRGQWTAANVGTRAAKIGGRAPMARGAGVPNVVAVR